MTLMHYYSLAILRLSHDCLMYARSQCLQLFSTGTLICLHSTHRFTEPGNLVHKGEYERRIHRRMYPKFQILLAWAKFTSLVLYFGADLLQLVEKKKCWWIGTVFLFLWKFGFKLFFLSKKKLFKPHEVSQVFQTLVSLILAHQNAAHQALRPHVLARTVINFGRYFEKSFLHWFGTLLMMVKHVFVWTELRAGAMSIKHIQSGRELFVPVLPAVPQVPMGTWPCPSQTPEPAAPARAPGWLQSCSPAPPGSSVLFHGSHWNYSTIWQLQRKSSMNSSFLCSCTKWGCL